MKICNSLAVASLALLTFAPLSWGQAVELKPHWIPGKKYVQQMKMDQGSKMQMGGQTIVQQTSMTNEVETTAEKGQDPKKTRLRQRYQRVTVNVEAAGQKMHFDSSAPDAAGDKIGIGKMLGGMVGKELRIIVDENNKVSDVENLDELTKPMMEANPMAGQMLSGMFSKEMISQSFDQSSLKALPGKPVKPGDSWPYTVTMEIPKMGTISMTGKYTFKAMAQHGGAACAELTEEGVVSMNLNAAGLGGATTTADPKLAMKSDGGTIKGTLWFDPALGMARESQFTQNITMKMANPAAPGETMEVPTNQTISVVLSKVEDAK